MGLAESEGKEDPVELDSYPTLPILPGRRNIHHYTNYEELVSYPDTTAAILKAVKSESDDETNSEDSEDAEETNTEEF